MKTESLKLSKNIIALLEKNGITIATPIQKKIIPAILEGKDILAQSETGSGKTISFAVPIIEKTDSKDGLCALVLVPTRELCTQVTDEFNKFSRGKNLGVTAVYGGVSIENQIRKIKRTNIIVATPGRLIDLIDRNIIHLNKLKFLVFDEADRMLDMGFIRDIEKILKNITSDKLQTMLFSATVSKEITELSKKYLFNPVHVILKASVEPEFLQQTYYQTTQNQKLALLVHLLKKERDLTLVFCNRKHITSKLADKLSKSGIHAKCLHGDMSQSQRERVTNDFKHKKFKILIATDVASRGLHIEDISHVYNYEIPKDVDSYTHRVGRTARAGKSGEAISLVTNGEEQKFFKQILFSYKGIIKLNMIDDYSIKEINNSQHIESRREEKTKLKGKKSFIRDKSFKREKPFERDKSFKRENPFERDKSFKREKPFDRDKSFKREKPFNRDKSFKREKPFEKENSFKREKPFERAKFFKREEPFEKEKSYKKEKTFNREKPIERLKSYDIEKPFDREKSFIREKPFFKSKNKSSAETKNGQDFRRKKKNRRDGQSAGFNSGRRKRPKFGK